MLHVQQDFFLMFCWMNFESCKGRHWCTAHSRNVIKNGSVLIHNNNLLFLLTQRMTMCVSWCTCVSQRAVCAHIHLTPSATSITLYFQQSALLLIGIIYCCFMQRVLQVVQSLTPLLDFNACETGVDWTFTYSILPAKLRELSLFSSIHLQHLLELHEKRRLIQSGFHSQENVYNCHFIWVVSLISALWHIMEAIRDDNVNSWVLPPTLL